MKRNTSITNTILASGKRAPYDAQAKQLIGHKSILGHIMAGAIPHYKGMNPEEAAACIEGEPMISIVPTNPGLTNTVWNTLASNENDSKNDWDTHVTDQNIADAGERIAGKNTDDKVINEGSATFDIVFYARHNHDLTQIIVNVEIQQKRTPYSLLNRAIFYVSRLISSQKERDFKHEDYDRIKDVCSVWIVMNERVNSLTDYHLAADHLQGDRHWPGNLNMIHIIMIGISRRLPAQADGYDLQRLLGTLLSSYLPTERRLQIIEQEYHIPTTEDVEEGTSDMCNLSQGIVDDVIKRILLNMYRRGDSIEDMMGATELPAEEVQAYIDEALEDEAEDAENVENA